MKLYIKCDFQQYICIHKFRTLSLFKEFFTGNRSLVLTCETNAN